MIGKRPAVHASRYLSPNGASGAATLSDRRLSQSSISIRRVDCHAQLKEQAALSLNCERDAISVADEQQRLLVNLVNFRPGFSKTLICTSAPIGASSPNLVQEFFARFPRELPNTLINVHPLYSVSTRHAQTQPPTIEPGSD